MDPDTLLYRQIHPDFIQGDEVTTQAFKPGQGHLGVSAYNGDRISPEASWRHHTAELELESAGVLALTVRECRREGLEVRADPQPGFDEHVLIVFGLSRGGTRRAAKRLRDYASDRGWQYRPDSSE